MAKERATNSAESTLAGAINNSQVTITVNSSTPFPANPNFRLIVDTEIMLVTGVAGAVFTVTRGAEGTTAASHSSAAPISLLLTAGAMDQFADDRIIEAPLGDYSVTTNASRVLRASDAPYLVLNRSNLLYSPYMPIKTFDFAGSYTGFNLGAMSYTAAGDCAVKLAVPTTSSDTLRGYVTPYSGAKTFDVWISPGGVAENQWNITGICIGNATDDKRLTWMVYNRTGTIYALQFIGQYWTTSTTPSTLDYGNYAGFPQLPICLRAADDGVNTVTFSYSFDGLNFVTAYTRNYGALFTPNRIGIGINNNTGKTIHHWYANLWLR